MKWNKYCIHENFKQIMGRYNGTSQKMSLLLGYYLKPWTQKIIWGARYKDNWNNNKCQQKFNQITQVSMHKNINSIMMFSSKLYFVLLSFLSFPKDNYLSKVEAYQK